MQVDDAQLNEMVDQMFDVFDKDKNGYLDRNEMKATTQQFVAQNKADGKMKNEPTEQMIDDTMKMFDTNQDGKITKDEMKAYFKALFEAMSQAFGAL